MPKATFTKDFTFAPRRGVRIVYKAGNTYPVTSVCHALAVEAGAIAPASGGLIEKKGPLPLMGEK